jgi:type IV secretory pathway component VirB8
MLQDWDDELRAAMRLHNERLRRSQKRRDIVCMVAVALCALALAALGAR